MNEEQIDELLRSSPREMASDGFTNRVVASLDVCGADDSRRRRRVWSLSAAVVVLVLACLSIGLWNHEASRDQMRAQLAVLQKEARELREGLQILKQQQLHSRPVIYLGGNGDVDFVLDMNRYWQNHDNHADTRVIPAGYRGGSI